jgi:hypothetical protein
MRDYNDFGVRIVTPVKKNKCYGKLPVIHCK